MKRDLNTGLWIAEMGDHCIQSETFEGLIDLLIEIEESDQ